MYFTLSVPQPPLPGGGPLLLALPGAGCSPAIYDALAVPGWRVCAVDWSNGSRPLDPLTVAHRLGALLQERTAPTALAGHSAGAAIAALTAALYPGQVQALVLSNTGPHSRNHGDPSFLQRIRSQWGAPEQEAFLQSCFLAPPPAPLLAELRRYLAELPVEALAESVAGLRALDLEPHLGAIRAPTTIAHGEHDTRRRVADAQALAAAIPGAMLRLLPGGHTPMVDCLPDYQQAVAALLRPIAGASPP